MKTQSEKIKQNNKEVREQEKKFKKALGLYASNYGLLICDAKRGRE